MNKLFRNLLVGTILAIGASAVAFAGGATGSPVGTWTLNLARSKFNPGPAPQSQTRTYAKTAQGTALTVSGVAVYDKQ